MRTSVRSLAGAPRSGSFCTKSVIGGMVFQTGSSSLPSTLIVAEILRTRTDLVPFARVSSCAADTPQVSSRSAGIRE